MKTLTLIFVLFGLGLQASGQALKLELKTESPGKTQIADSLLDQTQFENFKNLEDQIDGLHKRLTKNGFIDATTDSIQRNSDSFVTAFLSIGKKVDSIRLYYNPRDFPAEALQNANLNSTDSSFTIPFNQLEGRLAFISHELSGRGRPFSSVTLKNISRSEHGLSAELDYHSTQKRRIDSVVVKGYEEFPRAYLKNFLGIKQGTAFNKPAIDRKLKRLNNLRFAESKRSPEVLFRENSTAIYLYLKKRNSNRFDGFLGFSTSEESSDLKLNGNVKLQLNNNLNFGEELAIKYRNTGDDQERIQADLKLPFVFNSPFGLHLGLDIFRRDSTFTTTDQYAKMSYQLTSHLQLEAGYRSSSSTANENDLIVGENSEDYQADYFTLGANFKIIDNYNSLTPVNTDINLELSTGNRSRENTTDQQYRLRFKGFNIFHLNKRNQIFVKNESAYLDSDSYLTNELFRFGGINSMRGFEENSLVSSTYTSFQTEYRYLLSQNLYTHSIIDFAYTENAQLQRSERLFSLGLGFGLKTKAGLLRVDIANGKSKDAQFKFKNTKVHLSLTAIF